MAAAVVAAFLCRETGASIVCAAEPSEEAQVALVIDDFGNSFGPIVRAFVELPNAVAFTVIPEEDVVSDRAGEAEAAEGVC